MSRHPKPHYIGQIAHWPGAYLIIDHKSGECYIGQSTDVATRLHTHHSELCRGCHEHSARMQEAFNRDGNDAFTFEALGYLREDVVRSLQDKPWKLIETLNKMENYYMSLYTCDFNTAKAEVFGVNRVEEFYCALEEQWRREGRQERQRASRQQYVYGAKRQYLANRDI